MAPSSTIVIVDLYFGMDLISELDFGVFLTNSFVCLAASINLEKEETIVSKYIQEFLIMLQS